MAAALLSSILLSLLQGSLYAVPSNMDTVRITEDIQVYRNTEVVLYIGSDSGDFQILDETGTAPEDYFIVVPELLPPGWSLSEYGETVYEDEFVVITRPGPDSPARPCAAARQLREIHSPRTESFDFPQPGFDDYVADITASVSQDSMISIIGRLELFETRYWSTDSFPKARDWAVNWLVREGCPVEIQNFPVNNDSSQNIVMVFPGTVNPDRYVVFGAHLDSGHNMYDIFPGADDNGSGSAAVMEAARAMVKYRFENTVILCLWGAEEAGLIGSDYFASQAFWQGDSILAVLNLDMILYGPTIGPSSYAILELNYNGWSQELAEYFVSATALYVPELETSLNYTTSGGSDHVSFWQYGFTAVGGNEFLFSPWYHSADDLLANYMDCFPYGTEVAKATAATLASLAVPVSLSSAEGGEEAILPSVSVNPSPASLSINVTLSGLNSLVQVDLFDLGGRRILRETVSGTQTSLDLSGVPNGIYLINASDEMQSTSARVVVVH